jgi:hypothetical protein
VVPFFYALLQHPSDPEDVSQSQLARAVQTDINLETELVQLELELEFQLEACNLILMLLTADPEMKK